MAIGNLSSSACVCTKQACNMWLKPLYLFRPYDMYWNIVLMIYTQLQPIENHIIVLVSFVWFVWTDVCFVWRSYFPSKITCFIQWMAFLLASAKFFTFSFIQMELTALTKPQACFNFQSFCTVTDDSLLLVPFSCYQFSPFPPLQFYLLRSLKTLCLSTATYPDQLLINQSWPWSLQQPLFAAITILEDLMI